MQGTGRNSPQPRTSVLGVCPREVDGALRVRDIEGIDRRIEWPGSEAVDSPGRLTGSLCTLLVVVMLGSGAEFVAGGRRGGCG